MAIKNNTPSEIAQAEGQASCSEKLTRKQFIDTVVKRAALAGGLVAGYKVIDKFLVPPAYAQASGGGTPGLPSNTVTDTIGRGGIDA